MVDRRPEWHRALFIHAVGAASILVACMGCGTQNATPEKIPVPVAPLEPSGTEAESILSERHAGPYARRFDGIQFTVPEGWREAKLTERQLGFIDARFLIPVDGEELQLTCSSVGGGVQANVDRWIGQFQRAPGDEPDIETILIDGTKATWVDLRGTFNPGMFGSTQTQENWRMLGVAIPMSRRDFYLKLAGPREAVSEVHDEFREFVRSGRFTD